MSRVVGDAGTGRGLTDAGEWRARVAWLEDENAALREDQERLEAERERLRGENDRLRAEGERLGETNQRLQAEVEALRRAAKRQAAPFSKGDPTPNAKRCGRKPGGAYGTRAHRRPPQRVDQVVAVGLPECCPGCGGELVLERVATQHVEDLPEPHPVGASYSVVSWCSAGRLASSWRRSSWTPTVAEVCWRSTPERGIDRSLGVFLDPAGRAVVRGRRVGVRLAGPV